MPWYSPSPRQKNLDSGAETVGTHGLNTYFHHFKRLQSKTTTGISATGREQGDQGLCWQQHLQQIHKGNIQKEVGDWKTQTLHLSSLVAAQKGQGCDPSDLKAQELRKGRDVIGFFFWALLMLKTLSSLLWKITWLLKSPLALLSNIERKVFAQCQWQLSCRGVLVLSQCDPTEHQHGQQIG